MERSILLALEALDVSHTAEAEEALHRAVQDSRVRMTLKPKKDNTTTEVLFSPDGSLLAVPNRQGLTLYDAETGEAIIELEGGASTTTYSPDGRTIAVTGIDGLVRILAANLGALLELAEARVTRSLTDEECRQYLHLDACPQQ